MPRGPRARRSAWQVFSVPVESDELSPPSGAVCKHPVGFYRFTSRDNYIWPRNGIVINYRLVSNSTAAKRNVCAGFTRLDGEKYPRVPSGSGIRPETSGRSHTVESRTRPKTRASTGWCASNKPVEAATYRIVWAFVRRNRYKTKTVQIYRCDKIKKTANLTNVSGANLLKIDHSCYQNFWLLSYTHQRGWIKQQKVRNKIV